MYLHEILTASPLECKGNSVNKGTLFLLFTPISTVPGTEWVTQEISVE